MYLQEFWSYMPFGGEIHPKDRPFFEANLNHTFKTAHRPATPFDGPLYSAKVVVCYANPGFSDADLHYKDLIAKQLSGYEPLPDIKHWLEWYEPRLRSIGRPINKLQSLVSIFNICPYASVKMTDANVRLAAGLPSVWAAQKHLREVLIPQALEGRIFLVIARKHQLWGIANGFKCPTIAITRNIGGYLSEGAIGKAIGQWLSASLQPKL